MALRTSHEANELNEPRQSSKYTILAPESDTLANQSVPAMENTARLNDSSKETGEPTTTGPWKNAFPVQLHCLLSEAETDGMAHIASFCVHGRAFQIHKLDLFVEKILSWSVSPSSTVF
jgi:hypothetical protein